MKLMLPVTLNFPEFLSQASYVCIPVIVGMGIMSSVTEGGYFHQGLNNRSF